MRMFKVSTGQPLQRFIMFERLQTARRILAEDHLSIKEIAAKLGFCSTAHFSNAFRRAEALTPSDYRTRSRSRTFDQLSARRNPSGFH